jgi:hypothetical protein
MVIAKPGVDGKVCVFTYATSGVLVDVAGFFPAGGFQPSPNPERIVDTRNGLRPVAAGQVLEFEVTGRAGVPVDAAAVALNVTAVDPSGSGYLTVFPCGQPVPNASNLNYQQGQTIPNMVIAKPGVDGKVCVFTYATSGVLVDVAGFFPAGGFQPSPNPERIVDTRNGL